MIKKYNDFVNENLPGIKPEIKPTTAPTVPKRNPLKPVKPKVNPQPKNAKEKAIDNIIKKYNLLKSKRK